MGQACELPIGIEVNFENVLGEMVALAGWLTPSPVGSSLSSSLRESSVKDELLGVLGKQKDDLHRRVIVDQVAYLIRRLAAFMRMKCQSLETAATPFLAYKRFFSELQNHFETGVYNLNYDTVAESAWPEAFTGFTDGIFDARHVGLRQAWDFIYHLHGSVHYSFSEPAFSNSVIWEADLSAPNFKCCRPLAAQPTPEFRPLVPSTLVAGGFKTDQLLTDPAQSFHASLIRHSHDADAFLIVGYGFGDAHVNRALSNRFELHPFQTSKRPPAVILTKNDSGDDWFAARQRRCDVRTWEMNYALNCRFAEMPGRIPTEPSPNVGEGRFETAYQNERISAWHYGFPDCLEIMPHIIDRLTD